MITKKWESKEKKMIKNSHESLMAEMLITTGPQAYK
jgi:hypothetical protein